MSDLPPPEIPVVPRTSDAPPLGADRLLEVGFPGRNFRLLLADVSATAFEAEFRHLSGRIAAVVMARTAVASILLGADLKGDERLSIQVRSEGPLHGLLAEADALLRFRGYTNKKALPGLDDGAEPFTVGLGTAGRLQIIRSTGSQVVYRGITALQDGDVASDLETALRDSVQIPSRLVLDHGYDRQLTFASGALLQALPDCPPAAFESFATEFGRRAEAARPFGRDLDRLLAALVPADIPHRILLERPVGFACRCSREKVVDMLRQLGPPEGGAHLPENGVTCVFCNDTYRITAEELG